MRAVYEDEEEHNDNDKDNEPPSKVNDNSTQLSLPPLRRPAAFANWRRPRARATKETVYSSELHLREARMASSYGIVKLDETGPERRRRIAEDERRARSEKKKCLMSPGGFGALRQKASRIQRKLSSSSSVSAEDVAAGAAAAAAGRPKQKRVRRMTIKHRGSMRLHVIAPTIDPEVQAVKDGVFFTAYGVVDVAGREAKLGLLVVGSILRGTEFEALHTELASKLERVVYPPNAVLQAVGAPCEALAIVISGSVIVETVQVGSSSSSSSGDGGGEQQRGGDNGADDGGGIASQQPTATRFEMGGFFGCEALVGNVEPHDEAPPAESSVRSGAEGAIVLHLTRRTFGIVAHGLPDDAEMAEMARIARESVSSDGSISPRSRSGSPRSHTRSPRSPRTRSPGRKKGKGKKK